MGNADISISPLEKLVWNQPMVCANHGLGLDSRWTCFAMAFNDVIASCVYY